VSVPAFTRGHPPSAVTAGRLPPPSLQQTFMPNSHCPPDNTRRSRLCRIRRCELSRPDKCVLCRSASGGRTAPPDTDHTQNAPVWRSSRLSSHRRTRHDKTVLSVSCLVWRCELAFKHVQSASSLTTFRQKLKLHLFRHSHPDLILQ